MDQVGGTLILEIRSAAAKRKISLIRLMGPTAQVIVGGVKQDLKRKHSLQTLNPKPLNLNRKLHGEP
jgi:hypothetical protein